MRCKIEGFTDRDACKKCKEPEGFCKHTVEDNLKDEFPSEVYGVQYLRRFLAISKTENKNLYKYHNEKDEEIKRLNIKIGKLSKELHNYEWLELKIKKVG